MFKMNGHIRRMMQKGSTPTMDPPRPGRLTYVIGDIHGQFALLDDLLSHILEDRAGRASDFVFLGDYIDRGPDSARVLQMLKELQTRRPDEVTCLMGNHERMMLDFLEAPEERAEHWLLNGGLETVASFGVGDIRADTPDARHRTIAQALRAAMPEGTEHWLRNLPLWWQSGTLIAAHALTDPAVPMPEQSPETLLWARPRKRDVPRQDGNWVVHGHTIVSEPQIHEGRIAIDTGAFRNSHLTAAVFDGTDIRFLGTTQAEMEGNSA